jgi:hypothetical protein
MTTARERASERVFATVPTEQRDLGTRETVPFIIWKHSACMQAITIIGAKSERVASVAREKGAAYWNAGESVSGAADMFAAIAKGAERVERAEHDASIGRAVAACRRIIG